jgi:hypothetical protein
LNKTGKTVVKSSTKLSEVNVKDNFTSHIDKKNIFDIFVDTLSLYIFIIWKSIVYNFFCRDGVYFDNILVSEYKLFKRSNKYKQLIWSDAIITGIFVQYDNNIKTCLWLRIQQRVVTYTTTCGYVYNNGNINKTLRIHVVIDN